MLIIYRFLINLVFFFSPLILFLRLIKKKEHKKRFKEKLCFFSKNRGNGKLLWFHGASVGEIQSVIPLIERFEKKKSIKKILITSNTLSSFKSNWKIKFQKSCSSIFSHWYKLSFKKIFKFLETFCCLFYRLWNLAKHDY